MKSSLWKRKDVVRQRAGRQCLQDSWTRALDNGRNETTFPRRTFDKASFSPRIYLTTPRFILGLPPHRPFIPSAGLAREIADRNLSNFPNGSFLRREIERSIKRGTRRILYENGNWDAPSSTLYYTSCPSSIPFNFHHPEEILSLRQTILNKKSW